MTEAILVHVPLPAINLGSAGGAGAPRFIQDVAWRQAAAAVLARLRPWLDGGWDIVPGTLGPHSLRIRPARGRRAGVLGAVLLATRPRRFVPGQVYEISATCLLRFRSNSAL